MGRLGCLVERRFEFGGVEAWQGLSAPFARTADDCAVVVYTLSSSPSSRYFPFEVRSTSVPEEGGDFLSTFCILSSSDLAVDAGYLFSLGMILGIGAWH